jgi:hypothetical protein
MSTPEQPATPPLTRKQMREIRNTGSNPIIPAAATTTTIAPPPAPMPVPPPPVVAPLPRAAAPVIVPDPPVPDAAVDLGVSPLTRRQARQQERIRTASVPVITPEVAAAHSASVAAVPPPAPMSAYNTQPSPAPAPSAAPMVPYNPPAAAAEQTDTAAIRDLFGIDPGPEPQVVAPAPPAAPDTWAPSGQPAPSFEIETPPAQPQSWATTPQRDAEPAPAPVERAVVNPMFGAGLLASDAEDADTPTSFDELIGRTSPGTGGTPHALIVAQASSAAPIVAPVSATGEVLVTGTLNLPEGLGSTGHAPGAADGKAIDASLVDGEIPAHSSPTPIAASAAVSTVKTPGDIIKPPAPEKGSKLMMSLAITAGVLALALVGVLILAFVTGVF